MSSTVDGFVLRQRYYIATVTEKILREEFPNPGSRLLGFVLKGGSAAASSVVIWNAISSVIGLPIFTLTAAINTVRTSFGSTLNPNAEMLNGGTISNPTPVLGGSGGFPFPLPISSTIDGLGTGDLTIAITVPAGGAAFALYTCLP